MKNKIDFTELLNANSIKPGDKLSSNSDAFTQMMEEGNRRRSNASVVFPKLNLFDDASKSMDSKIEQIQKAEGSNLPDLSKIAKKVIGWIQENIKPLMPSKTESVAALFGGMKSPDLSLKENGSGNVSSIELSGWGKEVFAKNLEFVESLGKEGLPVKHGFDYGDYAKIGLAKSSFDVMPDLALAKNENLSIEHGFDSYLQPQH